MKVFVTTQMRTGSTWLCDILANLLSIDWSFIERRRHSPQNFKKWVNGRNNVLYKMHYAHPKQICEHIKDNQTFVISITRDIKDTIISNLFYIRYDRALPNLNRLSEYKKVRVKLLGGKLNDRQYINTFIKEQTSFIEGMINVWRSYNDAYQHPKYLLLTYEQLHKNPEVTLSHIANFLGVNVNKGRIRKIMIDNDFFHKTRRKPGTGDNKGFKRKGIIGDWKNYFNQESIDCIKTLLGQQIIPQVKDKDNIFVLGGRSGTTLVMKCMETTNLRIWRMKDYKRQPEPKQILPKLFSSYPRVPDNIFPEPNTFDISKLPEFDFVLPQLIKKYNNPKFIICERPIEDCIASHIRRGWHKLSFERLPQYTRLWNALGNPKNPEEFSKNWFHLKIKERNKALEGYDQSKILRINFNNLIHKFNRVMTRIANFIGIEPDFEKWNKIIITKGVSYMYFTLNIVKSCGEKWVRESFESIKDQSDDIMVVDYSSTDNIEELANEYGFRFFKVEKTPNVYFHVSKLSNKAIIESKYKYFLRLTPDCIYPPNITDEVLKFYKRNDPNKRILVFEYKNSTPIDRPRRGRMLAYYKPHLIKVRGWDERTSYFLKEHVYAQALMYEVFKLKLHTHKQRLTHRDHKRRTRGNIPKQVKVLGEMSDWNGYKNFIRKLTRNINRFSRQVHNSYW